MSYTPNTWKSGDVVTSAKLNNMEQGIAAAGALVVNVSDAGELDKTWQEIYDAVLSGGVVLKQYLDDLPIVFTVNSVGQATTPGGDSVYYVEAGSGNDYYETASADGYPAKSDN